MKVEITVSAAMHDWFNNAAGDVVEAGSFQWKAVGEVFFDRTQSAVHVVSGDLKRSGKVTFDQNLTTQTAEVSYDTPYAEFEMARGGSHDALGRGFEATESMFMKALGETWTKWAVSR